MSVCRYTHENVSRLARVVCIAWVSLLAQAGASWGEPAWTHTGDCTICHTGNPSSTLLWVVNSDGQADPDGAGPLPALKVFQTSRGQTGKAMTVQLTNLEPGDGYAVEVLGLSRPGLLASSQLLYSADCEWADWVYGQDHFYSNTPRYFTWGTGPSVLTYNIGIAAAASYDYYEVVFAVAGIKASTGQRFYQEEHAYVSVPPPNWNPTVTMTSPANNATFMTPTSITLAATASDPDGTIGKVEFFAGSTLLGQVTAPPYSLVWGSVPAGSYALTARATDDLGAVTTSSAVNVVVSAPPPVPGDFDHDSDVDQTDYAHLQGCLTAMGTPIPTECTDSDLNHNLVVDSSDVMVFLNCMSGADVQGDPTCAN